MSPPVPSPAASLKRTVPAPNISYIKKRKVQDHMAVVMEKHSANLNMLTDKIAKCLESPDPPTTQRDQPEDALILSVPAALAQVPQEKRLACVIEVLQIVQKYTTEK